MTDQPINIAAFIHAVRDMNDACRGLGIKPPRSINFGSGLYRNVVFGAAETYKLAGMPGGELVVVTPKGEMEIDGVALKVAY